MPTNDSTPTSPPTAISPWLIHGGTLAAGAGVGGLIVAAWPTVSDFIDRQNLHVSSTWALLAILAGCGAVGGGLNAYLANSGIVLPRIQLTEGRLLLFPGILGNLLAGALWAVVTVWMVTPNQASDPEKQSNLLKGAMLASAFLAGLAGAAAVTGKAVSGRQPSDPAAATATATAALRALLNEGKLKEHFDIITLVGQAAAIGRDGGGLRVGVLDAAQHLDKQLFDKVKDLLLVDVDTRSLEAFLAAASLQPGLDAASTQALEAVRAAAHKAKEYLNLIPANAPLRP